MRTASVLAAALLAALPAAAGAEETNGVNAAAAVRQVSVEVREGGKLVGASSVRLQLGRPAAISMDGPFAMRLRIDAAEGAGFTVRPALTANGPDGWTPLRTPALTVTPGHPGKALVDRASGPPLEIAISVD
jgi:hypothetical protein